jgi:hypothetical protein
MIHKLEALSTELAQEKLLRTEQAHQLEQLRGAGVASETPRLAPETIASHTPAPTEYLEATIRRPRARLPDPAKFAGSTSDWPSWKITIISKLQVDGEAIGSDSDQLIYIFTRLEKLAWKNTTAFMQQRKDTASPHELLAYLERIYGNPNIQAQAARRLHVLRQKSDQPFSKFLPQLEREFADAGALEWADEPKRQIVLNSLNETMTDALRYRGVPKTFQGLIDQLHEISTDYDTLDAPRSRAKKTWKSQKREEYYDPMDWTPSSSTVKANRFARDSPPSRSKDQRLTSKRAKWVEPEELDRRREEGLCIRCGRPGCRIATCPLKPAKRPEETRRHLNTNKLEKTHRNGSVSTKKSRRREVDTAESSSEAEFATASESSGSEKE